MNPCGEERILAASFPGVTMADIRQHQLYINRENRTGVSVLSGSPISDVSDMPPYMLEIWAFSSDHEASIFIAGLEAAGTGNNLVYDRNLGQTDSNRIVIVGRMDEEVPFDASFDSRVRMQSVARISADSDSIRRTHEKNSQEWRERELHERAETTAILESIGHGIDYASRWGRQWARVGKGRRESFTITWEGAEGPFTLNADVEELGQGFIDIRPQMEEMAGQYGCSIDEAWALTFKYPIQDADALRAGIAVLTGLVNDLHEESLRIYHANFVAKTKMTAKWARMIIVGREDGIRTSVVRRMERARCGGDEIGRTDIHTLLGVGWLERGGQGLVSTQAGIEAAERKLGGKTPKNN
jgi:hypothetical protein